MKRKVTYYVNQKPHEKTIEYIPFRYIVAFLISLLETAAVILIVVMLSIIVPYFYIAAIITQIACTIKIIASDDNPDYKVPWLLFVLVLPIIGFMLYFLFYSRRLDKKHVKRIIMLDEQGYLYDDSTLFNQLKEEDLGVHNQVKMLCKIADTHLFNNTLETYYPLGDYVFSSMLDDLSKAKSFIFLEYFIIEEGLFWNSILEILKEKVENGVIVKVIYDDIGCMNTLPGDYYKELRKFKIDAVPFSRLRGNANNEFNNRSHRKIMVIDGYIGYTGGINIADEYINKINKLGHWKDIAIRLEGEAVWELTRLFWRDFYLNNKKNNIIDKDFYYPHHEVTSKGFVVPFGDGPYPLYERRVSKSVIENMVNNAKEYVYITTPYLIIDNDLCQTIENAALRGVAVKIIVPHIPDKRLVFEITKSYYYRLLKSGVMIYEYKPGFIHAKCYLSDDSIAMIGTINLDYRSLVHHFENGVFLYNTDCISSIKDDIEDTLSKSIEIKLSDIKTTVFKRILRSLVRIFAPLI